MADEKLREIRLAYNRMWKAKNRDKVNAYAREYYARNRDAVREKDQAYRAENRDRILERDRDRIKAWHDANPEARKEHKRRYREANREKLRAAERARIRDENGQITAKAKAKQRRTNLQVVLDLEALAGRPRPEICDICGGPSGDPKRGMHFDHCHKSDAFRGWLCRKCNLMLGHAEDNPDRLRAGAAYLEQFAASNSHSITG